MSKPGSLELAGDTYPMSLTKPSLSDNRSASSVSPRSPHTLLRRPGGFTAATRARPAGGGAADLDRRPRSRHCPSRGGAATDDPVYLPLPLFALSSTAVCPPPAVLRFPAVQDHLLAPEAAGGGEAAARVRPPARVRTTASPHTGSYRSAWSCRSEGLHDTWSRRERHDLKRVSSESHYSTVRPRSSNTGLHIITFITEGSSVFKKNKPFDMTGGAFYILPIHLQNGSVV